MENVTVLIAQEPNKASLYSQRAEIFYRTNRTTEALADMKKTCELAPTVDNFMRYGEYLLFAGVRQRSASEINASIVVFQQAMRVMADTYKIDLRKVQAPESLSHMSNIRPYLERKRLCRVTPSSCCSNCER
jgi:hypothetical protein